MSRSSRKISISRVIRKIRALNPKTASDIRAAGIRLRLLGKGLYRNGFKVVNCDLVIKMPIETGNGGREHSASEMRRIRRLRQFGKMEKFLPEIFYYNKTSGVLAMRYYPAYESFEDQADALGTLAGELIWCWTTIKCNDIHTENVREGPRNAVIIDLGL